MASKASIVATLLTLTRHGFAIPQVFGGSEDGVDASSRYETLTAIPTINLTLSSLRNITYTSYPSQIMTVVTSAQLLPTDYSEEAWSSLWNQVGPVETPPFNYTVSPTPEPSHPAPPLGLPTKVTHANNSAYQLPKDFVWGLCSAAYQVEGAVKEEGRGPSVSADAFKILSEVRSLIVIP